MGKNVKNTIEKLEDVSLENVFGGGYIARLILSFGGVSVIGLSILGGIGSGVANTICEYRAKSKRAQGDIRSAEKFEKAARILGITALAVGVGGPFVGFGVMQSAHLVDE